MPQRESASSPTQAHPHVAVRITGDLDPDALARCLGLLAESHPGLGARIDRRTGRPLAVANRPAPASVSIVETFGRLAADREHDARCVFAEDARQPFEPGRTLLLRATLVRLGEADHALQLCAHAAVADQRLVAALAEELPALYAVAGSRRRAAGTMLPHFGRFATTGSTDQPAGAAFRTSGSTTTLPESVVTQA